MRNPDAVKNEANQVITDNENETGEHPIGKVVHMSTVTHAFRGRLVCVTASYYILADASIVHDTGAVAAYRKNQRSASESEEEHIGDGVRVLRSAVVWCIVF